MGVIVSDVLRAMTLIMDNNDADRHRQIVAAARDAVAGVVEGRDGFTVESYRWVFNQGSSAREFHRVVGDAVADLLSEWLDDLVLDEWWKAILVDILDLHNSGVRRELGEHYLPYPDDVADLFADGDDDGL